MCVWAPAYSIAPFDENTLWQGVAAITEMPCKNKMVESIATVTNGLYGLRRFRLYNQSPGKNVLAVS